MILDFERKPDGANRSQNIQRRNETGFLNKYRIWDRMDFQLDYTEKAATLVDLI